MTDTPSDVPAESAAATPARRRFRWRRFGCIAGIVLALLLVVAVLGANAILLRVARGAASEALGMPVTIDAARLALGTRPTIRLSGVGVGPGEGLVRVASVTVTAKRLSLGGDGPSVLSVEIEGLDMRCPVPGTADGEALRALVDRLSAPSAPGGEGPAVRLEGLTLRGARLALPLPDGGGEAVLRFDALEADLPSETAAAEDGNVGSVRLVAASLADESGVLVAVDRFETSAAIREGALRVDGVSVDRLQVEDAVLSDSGTRLVRLANLATTFAEAYAPAGDPAADGNAAGLPLQVRGVVVDGIELVLLAATDAARTDRVQFASRRVRCGPVAWTPGAALPAFDLTLLGVRSNVSAGDDALMAEADEVNAGADAAGGDLRLALRAPMLRIAAGTGAELTPGTPEARASVVVGQAGGTVRIRDLHLEALGIAAAIDRGRVPALEAAERIAAYWRNRLAPGAAAPVTAGETVPATAGPAAFGIDAFAATACTVRLRSPSTPSGRDAVRVRWAGLNASGVLLAPTGATCDSVSADGVRLAVDGGRALEAGFARLQVDGVAWEPEGRGLAGAATLEGITARLARARPDAVTVGSATAVLASGPNGAVGCERVVIERPRLQLALDDAGELVAWRGWRAVERELEALLPAGTADGSVDKGAQEAPAAPFVEALVVRDAEVTMRDPAGPHGETTLRIALPACDGAWTPSGTHLQAADLLVTATAGDGDAVRLQLRDLRQARTDDGAQTLSVGSVTVGVPDGAPWGSMAGLQGVLRTDAEGTRLVVDAVTDPALSVARDRAGAWNVAPGVAVADAAGVLFERVGRSLSGPAGSGGGRFGIEIQTVSGLQASAQAAAAEGTARVDAHVAARDVRVLLDPAGVAVGGTLEKIRVFMVPVGKRPTAMLVDSLTLDAGPEGGPARVGGACRVGTEGVTLRRGDAGEQPSPLASGAAASAELPPFGTAGFVVNRLAVRGAAVSSTVRPDNTTEFHDLAGDLDAVLSAFGLGGDGDAPADADAAGALVVRECTVDELLADVTLQPAEGEAPQRIRVEHAWLRGRDLRYGGGAVGDAAGVLFAGGQLLHEADAREQPGAFALALDPLDLAGGWEAVGFVAEGDTEAARARLGALVTGESAPAGVLPFRLGLTAQSLSALVANPLAKWLGAGVDLQGGRGSVGVYVHGTAEAGRLNLAVDLHLQHLDVASSDSPGFLDARIIQLLTGFFGNGGAEFAPENAIFVEGPVAAPEVRVNREVWTRLLLQGLANLAGAGKDLPDHLRGVLGDLREGGTDVPQRLLEGILRGGSPREKEGDGAGGGDGDASDGAGKAGEVLRQLDNIFGRPSPEDAAKEEEDAPEPRKRNALDLLDRMLD